MSAGLALNAPLRALRSSNPDWVRALQRTSAIKPSSTRTLAVLIDDKAAAHPEHPALVDDAGSLSYGALRDLSNRCAHWALGQGLRRGDRVALLMRNRADYPAIWIGLSRIGIVTALINTQLVGAGLTHSLDLTEARHIIVDAPGRDALKSALDPDAETTIWTYGVADADLPSLDDALGRVPPGPPPAPDIVTLADPALLIFTSGTTGLPKAAYVSHYRILMWSEWFAGILDASEDDRLYDCLPMYHSVGGVVGVGAMLAAGGTVIVRDGFSARRFWPDVAASGATIFQYIGELCRYLVGAPAASTPHRLRLCFGNGMRADVWETFEQRFAIPRIIEFYAATEGSFSLFNLEGKPGAIGRIPRFMAHLSPVAVVRFDIDAEQPIRDANGFCLRCGPNEPGEAIGALANGTGAFEGYTSARESARKVLRDVFKPGDAWFRTGDLMRIDAQGFFSFVDRIGDTFRWKGENVSTTEVANALCACPGVEEALVYGVEVPGQDGRAGMAALKVGPEFDMDRLWRHVAATLPRFAHPLFLRLASAFEATGTFKPKKADLVRSGFDPGSNDDPIFVWDDAGYRPLDAATHARILVGDLRL